MGGTSSVFVLTSPPGTQSALINRKTFLHLHTFDLILLHQRVPHGIRKRLASVEF